MGSPEEQAEALEEMRKERIRELLAGMENLEKSVKDALLSEIELIDTTAKDMNKEILEKVQKFMNAHSRSLVSLARVRRELQCLSTLE